MIDPFEATGWLAAGKTGLDLLRLALALLPKDAEKSWPCGRCTTDKKETRRVLSAPWLRFARLTPSLPSVATSGPTFAFFEETHMTSSTTQALGDAHDQYVWR